MDNQLPQLGYRGRLCGQSKMKWKRIRRWSFVILVVLVLAFGAVSWFVCEALVAPANRPVGPPPGDLSAESINIPSDSGSSLAAWFVPCNNSTATIILLHPVRSNRRSMVGRAKLLRDAGYSTLLVDLQAHGESPGEHITAGFLERHDVAAAVQFVRSQDPDQKIGVVGCSLGGAATLLAAPLEIDALVLESVYPTITDAIHDRISMRLGPLHYVLAPALLVQLKPRLGISPSQLRPIDNIATVDCPVLVAAGDLDLHTTLAETKRLYNTAVEPKQLVIFNGAAHTDLLTHDPVKYRNDVVGFLDACLRQTIESSGLQE